MMWSFAQKSRAISRRIKYHGHVFNASTQTEGQMQNTICLSTEEHEHTRNAVYTEFYILRTISLALPVRGRIHGTHA